MIELISLLFFLIALYVLFVELCKLGRDNGWRTFSVVSMLFGWVTFYGYFFEKGIVNLIWLKSGIVVFLIGVSLWIILDRRHS
jgi:hypothetical protein